MSGTCVAQWEICWGKTIRWHRRISRIVVWICCLSIETSCLFFLKGQWGNLFGVKYDVLLYDLTSTYFESDPPTAGSDSKKRFGYSRDKRSDCVQVVVALVLTPEGFPVAYEVYPGNTRDTATLEEFLDRIEKQYGKLRRTFRLGQMRNFHFS